jgi:hypothetical protein
MFTQKNANGKTQLTNFTKMLGSILTIVGFIVGGVLYFETTYMHKADAEEMRAELESQTVQTFQRQQEILDLQKKDQERTMDMRFLEQLQTQKILIKKELIRSPSDTWLKEKERRVNDLIKKLEDKLFQ